MPTEDNEKVPSLDDAAPVPRAIPITPADSDKASGDGTAPNRAAPAGQEELAPFHQVAPDVYEAALLVSEPDTPTERVRRLVLGQPIPERLAAGERLNKVRALATLSSDALSSVAYGTEASLAVLIAAGAAALSSNLVIGVVTAGLMLIVGSSYRQTISAYPSGGGSYIVARDNLGVVPGLIAAAALLTDYVLTVSVSVASGVDAFASAFPFLSPARLGLELGAIVLITLVNLRGLRTSGTVFAFPTYFFLVSFGLTLLIGVVEAITHGGLTAAISSPSPPVPGTALAALTPLLLLTAFSSGCSAMTGVEAISNGVPAFEGDTPERQSRNAAQTLVVMIALLVTFFVGTTYLAWRVGAAPYPSGTPTVTSQIAHFAFAGAFGWLFYVVQIATLLILVFAANTSFADFPRLSAILARDSFLPALFAFRGERLAFSTGIGALGIVSAVVLAIFRGNVVALINLYALGVFTAFTLSQSGMVVHWLRRRTMAGWQRRLFANGLGACATGLVTVIIAITKFDRGAWVVVVLVPVMVAIFLFIRAYYHRPRRLRLPDAAPLTADVVFVPILSHEPIPHPAPRPIPRSSPRPPPGALPPPAPSTSGEQSSSDDSHPWTGKWPTVLAEELAYAARIAPERRIIRVVEEQSEADGFLSAWNAYVHSRGLSDPALPQDLHVDVLLSPYRTVVRPLANFLEWQHEHALAGRRVAVLLPREEHPAWWEWLLQRGVAVRLRRELQRRGSALQLVDVPYSLEKGIG